MSVHDIAKLRGRLVLLESTALEALKRVTSMRELAAWERVFILGQPPYPRGGALFTTLITKVEILEWLGDSDLPIKCLLVDVGYHRWLKEDQEQAERYSGVWTGHVEPVPGGYQVWIEAETEPEPSPRDLLERAQVLASQWHELGGQTDVAGLGSLRELDAARGEIETDLAEILMALLPTLARLAGEM
ncbi:MAG: hypothetical protein GWN58_68550 [Anaerolineae bacterium]|nr:hypothetical protein [Anaerolineae bacterium]